MSELDDLEEIGALIELPHTTEARKYRTPASKKRAEAYFRQRFDNARQVRATRPRWFNQLHSRRKK